MINEVTTNKTRELLMILDKKKNMHLRRFLTQSKENIKKKKSAVYLKVQCRVP